MRFIFYRHGMVSLCTGCNSNDGDYACDCRAGKYRTSRAISMVSVRLATVISPAIGGILIAASGVATVYWVSTVGTLLTVFLLMGLPALKPQHTSNGESPLRQLAQGFKFVLKIK